MRVYEGTIISCDEENHVYDHLVEDMGKIIYVGNGLPKEYHEYEKIQLKEGALMPSFVDTHLHFGSMALFNQGVNVMDASSNEEIKETLRRFMPTSKAKVIIGFGASPHSVEDRHLLSRKDLDEVSTLRPIMVVKYDGHAAIINTPFLELLPEKIQKLRGYNPDTGEMNQEAFFATTDYVSSKISLWSLIKSMQSAIDDMASKGIGMIHTVSGVGFPRDMDVDLERYVGRGVKSGFQMRLFFQTMDVDKVVKRGLPRIGGCFATALDGCFGSVDAALTTPYVGSDDCGVLYYSDKKVIEFCKKANRMGLQIELHAIGDAAFNQGTKAIKAALDDYPRKDHRHGIIHACLPTEEGIRICSDYGIHIPLQTAFIDWPQEPGQYLREILGERESALNPLRTLVDNNIIISAGSDAPCTDPDPMLWIHNACNHSEEDQSLSVEEALRMATYYGYYTSFDEKERGSLEKGKIADMVVLSANPYTVNKNALKEIKVKQLFLAGKPYKKEKRHWLSTVISGMFSRKRV